MPTAEPLLVIALVVFYLADSMLLLHPDEAVLQQTSRLRFLPSFGWLRFSLAGREPWLPNPFTPHRPVLRLRWTMAEIGRSPCDAAVPETLHALAPGIWIVWLALFVGAPSVLLLHLGMDAALAVAAIAYAAIVAVLVAVWLRRESLGLAPRVFVRIAYESLICAPLALNLVRRLSLRISVQEDFLHATARLCDVPARAHALRGCLARLDERIEAEPDEGPALDALRLLRSDLEAKGGR